MNDNDVRVSHLLQRVNHLEMLSRLADRVRDRDRAFVLLINTSRTTTRNLRRVISPR